MQCVTYIQFFFFFLVHWYFLDPLENPPNYALLQSLFLRSTRMFRFRLYEAPPSEKHSVI